MKAVEAKCKDLDIQIQNAVKDYKSSYPDTLF